MEEVTNLTQDDVLELITDFPVQPLRNKVIITTNVEELNEDDIDLVGNSFSPEQFVLAAGSHVQFIQPGQKIHLDLEAMTIKINNSEDSYNPIQKISLKPIKIGERIYGMITDDKIEYLIK